MPSLATKGLVVDLDATAAVHKTVVATWQRTPGCTNDKEQRQFAHALARHRQRFAFPDKFNELVKPIRRWFEDKAGKNSPAGRLVDATREVRVGADDWNAPTYLIFFVLTSTTLPGEAIEWQVSLEELATRRRHPSFPPIEFRLAALDDISAAEYLASDRLDWDGLSDA